MISHLLDIFRVHPLFFGLSRRRKKLQHACINFIDSDIKTKTSEVKVQVNLQVRVECRVLVGLGALLAPDHGHCRDPDSRRGQQQPQCRVVRHVRPQTSPQCQSVRHVPRCSPYLHQWSFLFLRHYVLRAPGLLALELLLSSSSASCPDSPPNIVAGISHDLTWLSNGVDEATGIKDNSLSLTSKVLLRFLRSSTRDLADFRLNFRMYCHICIPRAAAAGSRCSRIDSNAVTKAVTLARVPLSSSVTMNMLDMIAMKFCVELLRQGFRCACITFYPLSHLIDPKPPTQTHTEHQKRHVNVFNCPMINCQDRMVLSFLILLFSMFPPNLLPSAHPAFTLPRYLSPVTLPFPYTLYTPLPAVLST